VGVADRAGGDRRYGRGRFVIQAPTPPATRTALTITAVGVKNTVLFPLSNSDGSNTLTLTLP
jgi:hypothetical protein